MPNQLVMRKVLIEADRIWKNHGKELVVTSGMDGTHSAGSYHYYGYALDFRSFYFKNDKECEQVAQELRDVLGKAFYVKYEKVLTGAHIHCHYIPNL